jgi:transcription-repair coupling factor (superfamily II helicase)
VSQGTAPAGIEYYLPLFFDNLDTLFDYLPTTYAWCRPGDIETAAESFSPRRHSVTNSAAMTGSAPSMHPEELFLTLDELRSQLSGRPGIRVERQEQLETTGARSTSTWAPCRTFAFTSARPTRPRH